MKAHLAEHVDVASQWVNNSRSEDGTPCLVTKAWGMGAKGAMALVPLLGGRVVSNVQFGVDGMMGHVIHLPLLATVAGCMEALSRMDRKIAELEEHEAVVPSKAGAPLVHA